MNQYLVEITARTPIALSDREKQELIEYLNDKGLEGIVITQQLKDIPNAY